MSLGLLLLDQTRSNSPYFDIIRTLELSSFDHVPTTRFSRNPSESS